MSGNVKRIFNPDIVNEIVHNLSDHEINLKAEDWVKDERNILLSNTAGDYAMFEFDRPGIVIGHYYFKSRGKQALENAKQLLAEIFDPCYNIQVIKGITALDHLGARWLTRRLGFKSYGVIHAQGRAAELFILTREEYENK